MYRIHINQPIDDLIQQINNVYSFNKQHSINFLIDFQHLEFIFPYKLAVLASWVESLRLNFEVFVDCVNIHHNTESYVSRMNFFDEIRFPYVETFYRQNEKGRFIPIRRINEDNRYTLATDMVKIMEKQWTDVHRSVISSLNWAIHEITDNIFNHSYTQIDGFAVAQYFPQKREIEAVIIDNGIGIPRRLRENPKYASRSNQDVLKLATDHKITTDPDEGVGAGLYYTKCIIQENRGRLIIYSNDAHLTYDDKGMESRLSHFWQGTIIRFVIKTNKYVDHHKIWGNNLPPTVLDYLEDGTLW